MSDLTAENNGYSRGGPHGPAGTSDDDLNAELDADRDPEGDVVVEHTEFDEGLGT